MGRDFWRGEGHSFTPEKVADFYCHYFTLHLLFPFWKNLDKTLQDRTLTHLPQKFDALRHVPGYKDFMTERFKRREGKAVQALFPPVETPSLSHVWEMSLQKWSKMLTKVTHYTDMWYVMLIVTTHILYVCLFNHIIIARIWDSHVLVLFFWKNDQQIDLHADLHETSDSLVYLWRSSRGNGWSKLASITHPIFV